MNNKDIINDEVVSNEDYFNQSHGGILGEKEALAELMFKDNGRYAKYKGDWTNSDWVGGGFTKITTGRKDGKFFITREQHNIEAIKAGVKRYREMAEAGIPDPLAPIGQDGKLQWSWMVLPNVISQRISDQYFGGLAWDTLKRDKTLKAQFYRVVQQEYPEYICFPGGKLPIPIDVPYPAKVGETKFFKGI